MEEKNKIESVVQHLNDYFETRWKLFVLNSSDKASDILSSIASVFLIALSMMFVLLFLSISSALWIGHSLGNTSIGFLYVGLFYLVVTILLFFFRHTLIKIPVINKLLNSIYSDEKD